MSSTTDDRPDIPVYLEYRDPMRGMARFYAIAVEPTLFGDWATICRWGRIGSVGQRQEFWFPHRGDALDAARTARDRKWRRGYRPPGQQPVIAPPAVAEPLGSARPRSVSQSQYVLTLD